MVDDNRTVVGATAGDYKIICFNITDTETIIILMMILLIDK